MFDSVTQDYTTVEQVPSCFCSNTSTLLKPNYVQDWKIIVMAVPALGGPLEGQFACVGLSPLYMSIEKSSSIEPMNDFAI